MMYSIPSGIPSPEYVWDIVDGVVFQTTNATVLVIGAVPPTLSPQKPVVSGVLFVRYALTLLVPPGVVFIPGLFAAEKGGILVGREAWDFVQSNFGVHPRADVLGIGVDGKTVQALIREIDFGVPVKVFVYNHADAITPVAEVTQLMVGDNALPLPVLLTRYLPVV